MHVCTCARVHVCTHAHMHTCTCRISQGWPQRAAAGLALLWCGLGAAAMPHLGPSPSDPTPTPTPIPPLLLTQVLLRCCCSASAAWERGCGAARRSTACAGEGEESGAGCTSTVCSHVQRQPPHGLRPPRPPASIRPASAMRASAGRPPADRPGSANWQICQGWATPPPFPRVGTTRSEDEEPLNGGDEPRPGTPEGRPPAGRLVNVPSSYPTLSSYPSAGPTAC